MLFTQGDAVGRPPELSGEGPGEQNDGRKNGRRTVSLISERRTPASGGRRKERKMRNPFHDRKRIWLFPVLIAVFLFFFLRYGVLLTNDSWNFLEANLRVSPLYPLLVRCFTALFGDERGLTVLVAVQELLAAYAVYSTVASLSERFRLDTLSMLLFAAAFAGAYALRLITAGTDALYCNTVQTEGISYPVYALYIKYVFFALDGADLRALLTAAVMSFILTATRGQLIHTVIVAAAVFAVILVGKRREGVSVKKELLKGVFTAAGYFACITLLSCTFHYVASGRFMPTSMGKQAVFGALLYTSSSEDAALMPEGDERILVGNALIRGEKEKKTARSAPKSPVEAFRHYEASHDALRGFVRYAAADRYGESDEDRLETVMDGVANTAIPVLLAKNAGRYLKNCVINAFGGFVRSNSIMSRYGAVWSAAVYAAAVLMLLFFRGPVFGGERGLLIIVLSATAANCVFCSFGVFELSRYVFYVFPWIYASEALLLRRALLCRKGNTERSGGIASAA